MIFSTAERGHRITGPEETSGEGSSGGHLIQYAVQTRVSNKVRQGYLGLYPE